MAKTTVKKGQDLTDFLAKYDSYFSEGHLMSWFTSQYLGLTKTEIKYKLEREHDNTGETENAEQEIGRKLTDKEIEKLEKRFFKAVYKAIEFKRGIAIGYYDSIGNFNH